MTAIELGYTLEDEQVVFAPAREHHLRVLGRAGVGKTSLLRSIVAQALDQGAAVSVIATREPEAFAEFDRELSVFAATLPAAAAVAQEVSRSLGRELVVVDDIDTIIAAAADGVADARTTIAALGMFAARARPRKHLAFAARSLGRLNFAAVPGAAALDKAGATALLNPKQQVEVLAVFPEFATADFDAADFLAPYYRPRGNLPRMMATFSRR